MAIVQCQTDSFKKELYQGYHALDSDVIKIALYTGDATLGPATMLYTSDGETSGFGYIAGGKIMLGVTVYNAGGTAYVGFPDVSWIPADFTARGALIYNASKGNRAIAVLDFGSDKVATSTFTVPMPVAAPTTALIRTSS